MEHIIWNKRVGVIVIAILLIFLFVGLNLSSAANAVKNVFHIISSPIQKFFLKAGDRTSDFFEAIFRAEDLKKENELLKQKNQKLLEKIATLGSLKKENETLRQALDIGLEKDFVLTLAKFVGKDVNQDLILINKGSEDGISKNLTVITQEKVLCGKVKEVYKNFSVVSLISDKEMSFDAKILEKEINGVIKGKGSSALSFELIPREQNVQPEDVVVTSALGGIFPEGLLVGKIEKVEQSDVEPFQRANVSPFCQINEIKNLFVIIK